jgi:hypothetical protein
MQLPELRATVLYNETSAGVRKSEGPFRSFFQLRVRTGMHATTQADAGS